MLIIVIVVVAAVIVVTGGLYLLVKPARRFIKRDQPLWWVRDILIAVLVAVLVLFGQSYLVSASDAREHGGQAQDQQDEDQGQDQDEDEDQRISDLNFVRFKSSGSYQDRPFRAFDLNGMNLAGLELRGANFVEANLGGANLTGIDLRQQNATPVAPGQPAIPTVRTLLSGANLCNAVLTGANLQYAFLINANLTGADLTFARLRGAVLNGSDLSGATMPAEAGYLDGIYYDDSTVWPEGFQPPPTATGGRLDFLNDPTNNKLYGDIQRPACNS
ncbi:MAG: pentapeptide repeat-containing protein [Actinomycetia bacterium]|nr:pentapeptide repeat-containing protein [Actinomycetes bacterium]